MSAVLVDLALRPLSGSFIGMAKRALLLLFSLTELLELRAQSIHRSARHNSVESKQKMNENAQKSGDL